MRHQIVGKKLGRTKDQRNALRRNLVKQLFENGRVKTTHAKALAVRGQAEKLITLAKRGSKGEPILEVNARRLAAARIGDATTVTKLFDDIAPRFENRPGGYTRIIKLGPRLGDAAELVVLELVEE